MKGLFDKYGRVHNYLRLSLTDACNFRCFYCMPEEEVTATANKHLMQVGEIEQIAKQFIDLGVNKIRLTGGEPLVRKEAPQIIEMLSQMPVELTMTTNAVLVKKHLDIIKSSSIKSLNVSLDTLDADKFYLLCKRDQFKEVWDNIELLLANDFHVKINLVLIKGVNDNEVSDFISLTKNLPLHVRFIEFMPFDKNQWNDQRLVSYEQIIAEASNHFDIIKLQDAPHATTKKFKVIGHAGTFAVISTMTNPFCDSCNRIRLTADGKIKNCLFSQGEFDILTPLRQGKKIETIIRQSIEEKEKELGGQLFQDFKASDSEGLTNRSMISIGG